MKDKHYIWLTENKQLLGNNTPNEIQRDYMYLILSDITGVVTKHRGCGRCLMNMKRRLITEFEKYEQR